MMDWLHIRSKSEEEALCFYEIMMAFVEKIFNNAM